MKKWTLEEHKELMALENKAGLNEYFCRSLTAKSWANRMRVARADVEKQKPKKNDYICRMQRHGCDCADKDAEIATITDQLTSKHKEIKVLNCKFENANKNWNDLTLISREQLGLIEKLRERTDLAESRLKFLLDKCWEKITIQKSDFGKMINMMDPRGSK